MKSALAMSEFRTSNDAPLLDDAAHYNGIRQWILPGLVLCAVLRTCGALAGEQESVANLTFNPPIINFRQSSQSATAAPAAADFLFNSQPVDLGHVFSATEFRPRKHTFLDHDSSVSAFVDAPMLQSTTVWQRMSDYKTHDGVRLLTLWESSGSTVSLQAGKRGDPSLQWTSRLMNHGGSTHGLLDRLFAASFAGATSHMHSVAGPVTTATIAKPSSMQVNASAK
jgi:hypothetical protein